MPEKLILRIADVSIVIEGDKCLSDLSIPAAYHPFVNRGSGEIKLRIHAMPSRREPGEVVFDSSPIWTLHHSNGGTVFNIFSSYPELKRLLVLNSNSRKADLYFNGKPGYGMNPFFGPTLELLMINYLARGRGVIVHACGVEYRGKGYLFVGESGAGKSTLARLWDRKKGVTVLSDDRIIVRKKGRRYWIYGTPWHGDAAFGSSRSLILEKIYFLRHGRANTLRNIKAGDAVTRFLQCSFPPFWEVDGMGFAMDLFNDLAAVVPAGELSFVPDESAIGFINESC